MLEGGEAVIVAFEPIRWTEGHFDAGGPLTLVPTD